MVKQPPQLLTRVIRAITALREPKGSSVAAIITQVRSALNDASSDIPRNFTMQVRRALKHAMDRGLVQQRAGKYRVAGKKQVMPVDSLELAVDSMRRKRRRTAKKRRRSHGRRRSSEHDKSKHGRRRRRHRSSRRRARASESQHSTASKPASAKAADQQREASPNASSAENSANNLSREPEHRGTPFPDSVRETSPGQRRRGRRRRRRAHRQSYSNRNHSDGPPTVEDEPMEDAVDNRVRSIARNVSPRRVSMPQQREQDKDADSLDEIHDRPPSYYN